MIGGRTLDLFVKQALVYRIEYIRIFSTKNVNAVTNWRQLKPQAPRKRKQPKDPITKFTDNLVTSKNKSLSSIQALESTSGSAQRKKGNNEVVESASNKTTELASSVKPRRSKLASYKKATAVSNVQREKVKETSAEDARGLAADVSKNEEVDFSRWKFHTTSCLGCTPGEVTQRVKELSQAGFCNEHIDLLLRRLPPTLQINSKTVYQNVHSFIKWNIPWKQLVDTNPEILLLEPNQVCYNCL